MIRRVADVQFHPWDQVYHFDIRENKIKVGDSVIVKAETGNEMGRVVNIAEVDEAAFDKELTPIFRLATAEDVNKVKALESRKDDVLSGAKELVKKLNISMKLIDCYFSFDGGRITLIFTAEGRVDFRLLVKDLARRFQKSIRLQQVGIRDEARRMGSIGPCGRELCCRKFISELNSVPTDLARIQQVHSRGSERISGSCGRLMCCLAYEADFYKKAMKDFPAFESQVKTKHGTGKVVSCNVLKKTVTVRIEKEYMELPLEEVKTI